VAEPRKPSKFRVNSNIERLKAEGKKFGGAEGKKQQEEIDENKIVTPEIKNVITGPVIDKVPVKALTDEEFAAAKAKAEADLQAAQTQTSNVEQPSKP